MKIYRVALERYDKETGQWDGREKVLVEAVDLEEAEKEALYQAGKREEAEFVRWEWIGTSLIGEANE